MKLERFLAKRKKTLEQFLNEMGFDGRESTEKWLKENGIEFDGRFVFFQGAKPTSSEQQNQKQSKDSHTDEPVSTVGTLLDQSPSSEDKSPKLEDTPSDRPKKSRKSSHEPDLEAQTS